MALHKDCIPIALRAVAISNEKMVPEQGNSETINSSDSTSAAQSLSSALKALQQRSVLGEI